MQGRAAICKGEKKKNYQQSIRTENESQKFQLKEAGR